MDNKSKAESRMWVVYGAHIFAWLCYLYILHFLNPFPRRISLWVQLSFIAFVAYSVVGGFVVRRKYLALASATAAIDSPGALRRWQVGNFIGFGVATTLALVGFALRILGSTWPVPAALFGAALAFLLLWRPRPL